MKDDGLNYFAFASLIELLALLMSLELISQKCYMYSRGFAWELASTARVKLPKKRILHL